MYMAPLGFRGVLGQPNRGSSTSVRGQRSAPSGLFIEPFHWSGSVTSLGAAEIENGDVHLIQFTPPSLVDRDISRQRATFSPVGSTVSMTTPTDMSGALPSGS